MEETATYGIVSLLPVLVVIVTAILTKRAAESLVLGTLIAAVLVAKTAFWGTWFDYTLTEIGDSAYYILMFGLFGVLIRMLDNSGAAMGFSDIGAKLANSRKKTMLTAWLLGIIIFIDDYINALGVGVAIKPISDKWKISRQFLAFIVNSTGAAVCILIPYSTWAVLYASQIEEVGVLGDISGLQAYINSIPFMVYAWAAVIAVPLFCLGILPLFGPMKKAEERALKENKVFPEDHYKDSNVSAENRDVDTGKVLPASEDVEELSSVKPSSAWNFVMPMAVLVFAAIYFEDIVLAVILACVVGFVMLWFQKRITPGEFCDSVVEGFKDMLYVTILVLAAFILQDFNDALGLTPFVIESVVPVLSPALFPAVIFIIIGALAFCTGSFWGVAAISFPIVLPLALALGVDPYLTIGSVAAGTSFGSHACFYSDAVTVTCAATGLKNMDYVRTSVPLIGVPFAVGFIAYLILGFVMA